MTTRTHDVVVVGAGPSGLSAARLLEDAGRDVVVLEARDRVGGRTWTVDVDGEPLDLGGQWVGPTQHHLLGTIEELGLTTDPTPTTGRSVLVVGGRRVDYRGTIPRLSLPALVQFQRSLSTVDRLARRVHPERAAGSRGQHLDRQTLAGWLHRRRTRPDVADVVRAAMRVVFGKEAEDIGLLAFLQYVRAAGGLLPLIETRDGAQDARIVGGAQQISTRLAAGLRRAVELHTEVRRVDRGDDGVVVTSVDGRRWRASRVVLAVPPHLVAAWEIDPPLPASRRAWLAGLEMGRTLKIQVRYGAPFWRDGGPGEIVWGDGPLDVAFDNSTPGGFGLVVFATGDHAARLGALSPGQRRDLVLDRLADVLGPSARDVVAYRDHDWATEPFTGGCPVATSRAGRTPADLDPSHPDGPIHWAGTETATTWRGFIDGAISAGRRAAVQVLTADVEPAVTGSRWGGATNGA